MSAPAVSVILPTHDRPALLPRALASLLAQTHADFEVILVDDNRGPRARTQAGLAPLLTDQRIKIIDTTTPGGAGPAGSAAAARNRGLAAARGEWITYLDDDDAYHPEKLAAQLALARTSNSPLVLCGYTVHLPRRQRTRQVHATAFRGDALLLDANWGTPFLFHRRDPAARFDASLRAGEDTPFALDFIARHHLTAVPNCPRSLVAVYPQIGDARVHRDGGAIWRAFELTAAQHGARFSPRAVRGFLAMGRLFQAQFGHGGYPHFAACAAEALAARGPGAWRLVLNATARRTGLFSRWAVS